MGGSLRTSYGREDASRPVSLQKLIGKQIKAKRISAGLTQKELGEQANFSHQTISKYENGERSLDIIAAFSLADNLDCSVEDFRPKQTSHHEPFDY